MMRSKPSLGISSREVPWRGRQTPITPRTQEAHLDSRQPSDRLLTAVSAVIVVWGKYLLR